MEEKKTNPYNKNNKLITLNPPAYKQRRSARDEGQRRRLLRIEKEKERQHVIDMMKHDSESSGGDNSTTEWEKKLEEIEKDS